MKSRQHRARAKAIAFRVMPALVLLASALHLMAPATAQGSLEAPSEWRQEFLANAPGEALEFAVSYGAAAVGPDWEPLNPNAAPPASRRGVIQWEGNVYLFSRETLYSDAYEAERGNRHCEWFDGKKTCRFNISAQTGVMYAGPQLEGVPGVRSLQGLLHQNYVIADVLRYGEEKPSAFGTAEAGSTEFVWVVDDSLTLAIAYASDDEAFPSYATVRLHEGRTRRTFRFEEVCATGYPHRASIETLKLPLDGTMNGAIRSIAEISASHIGRVQELRPWYPAGALFTDMETAEAARSMVGPLDTLLGMYREFQRTSGLVAQPPWHIKKAFDEVASQGQGQPYPELSMAQTLDVARAREEAYEMQYSCAASAAFAALLSQGIEIERASSEALEKIGARPLSLTELRSAIEPVLGLELAWEHATEETLQGLEGTYLFVDAPEGSGKEDPLAHVMLAHFSSGEHGRVSLLDFPKGVSSGHADKIVNDDRARTFFLLDLQGKKDVPRRAASSEFRLWYAGALLVGLALVVTRRCAVALQRSRGHLVVALVVASMAAGALVSAGCGHVSEDVSASTTAMRSKGIFEMQMEYPERPAAVGTISAITFYVFNRSDAPRPVRVLSKSCGCADISLDADVIPAGEAVRGEVRIPATRSGVSMQTMRIGDVLSNSVKVSIELPSYNPLLVRPAEIVLSRRNERDSGQGPMNIPLSGSFEVLLDGAEEVTEGPEVVSPPWMRVQEVDRRRSESDGGNRRWVLSYRVHANEWRGPSWREEVLIVLEDPHGDAEGAVRTSLAVRNGS